MSTNYGLAGSSPFATWSKPPSIILADFFATHWNSTETGAALNTLNFPISEVAWNEWYNADKDVSIKFYDSTTIIKSQGYPMIGSGVQEEDRIIHIHIFARSLVDDDTYSAETMLFNIEEHFKKVLMRYWQAELQQKGILKAYVRSCSDSPVIDKRETFNAVIRRRIMILVVRVWRLDQTL